MAPPRRLAFALALISAAALAYEILLTRLFSIIQWHHFAYMMISVALLGYGAAGTLVTFQRARLEQRLAQTFTLAASLFGVCAISAFLLAARVPFNALEFLWDLRQPLWLGLIYLLLFVPFFFAALCVCLMFTRYAVHARLIYSFDILGAAAGSLGIVALLFVVPPLLALALIGAAGLLAGALAAPRNWRLQRVGALGLALAVVYGGCTWTQPLRMSMYKELSQTLEVMGTRVVAERSSPLGQVTVVESPQIPLRYAPGLSLSAPGEPPEQLALFTDGEGLNAIQRKLDDPAKAAYLDYLTSAASYHLLAHPQVLILGAGTGADVLQAQYLGAAAVTAVELNPDVVRLVQDDFGTFSGRPFTQPGVKLKIGEARGFIASTRERYDLIQLALIDAFGASSAGLYALAESYLYTVESLQAYSRRVAPGGYLSMTRWVALPPRDTLKLIGMAAMALERNGVRDPGRRMALIRGWRTVTLLVKNGDLNAVDIDHLKAFCKSRSFDLDWYPGMRADEANRYNQLDQSWFHDGAVAMLGPGRASYIERYKFNIEPATDDKPYFFHFFRWGTLPELLRMKQDGGLPLLEWGYPLVVATLVQALLASAALILLPMWWLRRRAGASVCAQPWLPTAGYFGCIGMAFMFVEMAFIEKFTLFLSHPLYAVAVVLFAFLLSAGVGGRSSSMLRSRGAGGVPATVWPVVAITVLALGYAWVLPHALPQLAAWPDVARIAVAVGLIFPLGFAMGMPFPLGMAALADSADGLVPWAWGVNACASVVSTVLATLLAIHLGFDVVLLIAVVLYLLAACCFAPRTATVIQHGSRRTPAPLPTPPAGAFGGGRSPRPPAPASAGARGRNLQNKQSQR